METRNTLYYDDFAWRTEQIARERDGWIDRSSISLPALVRREQTEGEQASLLTFLYTIRSETVSDNPLISMPYAYLMMRPDGTLLEWELFAAPDERLGSAGRRFQGDTANLSVQDRRALILVYYELMTDADSPLWRPWAEVAEEKRRDLNNLFRLFSETGFRSLYEKRCEDYLKLISDAGSFKRR